MTIETVNRFTVITGRKTPLTRYHRAIQILQCYVASAFVYFRWSCYFGLDLGLGLGLVSKGFGLSLDLKNLVLFTSLVF